MSTSKKATPARVREALNIAAELAVLGERLPQVTPEYPSLAEAWRRRLHALRNEIQAQYPDHQEAHRGGSAAASSTTVPMPDQWQRQARLDACDD